MAENVLESYLVKISAVVDVSSFNKVAGALKETAGMVDMFSNKLISNFIRADAAITGMFTAIGLGIVGLMDKTATLDQQYRLQGLRMLMNKDSARAYQKSLDDLGATIEEVAFDPELNQRFQFLYEWHKKLGETLGSNFDSNMRKIRDYRMEFHMLTDELTYIGMNVASKLFDQLGLSSDDVFKKVVDFGKYIEDHIPEWSQDVTTFLIPEWERFKLVIGDAKDTLEAVTGDFQLLVGLLSGDESIQNTTVNAESLAKTFDHVSDALTQMVLAINLFFKIASHGFMVITLAAYKFLEPLFEIADALKVLFIDVPIHLAKGVGGTLAAGYNLQMGSTSQAGTDWNSAKTQFGQFWRDINADTANNPDFAALNRDKELKISGEVNKAFNKESGMFDEDV